MGYTNDTLKGFGWMGSLRIFFRLFVFVKIAILARILSPLQFGIFGIATLVLAFLEIITETGINIILIQENDKLEHYLDSAWAVSILRGVIISLVLFLISPLISSFFLSPESTDILRLISLVPLIRGFINPSIVKFQKNLEFKKEFILRITISFADTLLAVVLAILTKSALSLVIGMLFGAIIELIASHLFISPSPGLSFDLTKVKKIINKGRWITFAGIFNYLFQEGDDIVVGKIMSTNALGIYQVAYKISSLPITEISDVVIKVTFPIFTKISGDLKRLKRAFLKTLLAVGILAVPFGVILFIYTKEIVFILLGPKWLETVVIVKILAFFGVIRAITATFYPLFLSLKKQSYITYITLSGILGMAISIIPLVWKYGIVGASISVTIGAAIAFPVAIFFATKLFAKIKN